MARCGALQVAATMALVAVASAGCAGHSARTQEARDALDAGNPRLALSLYNEELGVDSEKQVPEDVSGDVALLLLDRSMILQQLEMYELSSRDLRIADKQIDLLDLSRGTADDIGKYLFSDDTGPYKGPAYEKLFINTMNMVNYLARSDLNGARIEARRLAVMQRYLRDNQSPSLSLSGAGSYLAGFTFEKSDRPTEALRYYDEALAYGSYASLTEPVRRLAAKSGYRSPRIRKLLKPEPAPPPDEPKEADEPTEADEPKEPAQPEAEPPPAPEPPAELLVITSFGRVPAKFAKRVPIGLALTYASNALSPNDRGRASALAAQGLVTWVNYPELGKPRGQYDAPSAWLGREPLGFEGIVAIDREAKAAWEAARGAIVAAAITRMLTRVVAGEAIRRSTDSPIGLLLSLGTQATLTATDTPDTRSWSTLPARIAISRVTLPAGAHVIDVGVRGVRKRQRVHVRPGGWAVVNLTVLN